MSALQLQIRPPLMRSCPSDPEEEEEGACVPLTHPGSGWNEEGWIHWEIHSGVRGHLRPACLHMMCYVAGGIHEVWTN